MELGIVMPRVHTRDNLDLPNADYAVKVHGVEVARGQAPRGKLLAIGENLEGLPGIDTRDPAFGGRAKWIPVGHSHQAAVAGVTVVDRSAVVTTHLAEIVREHAGELISRQDTKLLLDSVKAANPVVLEEMTAAGLTLGDVQGVLRGLLEEGVPVRDLVRIVEALTEQARGQQKDADSLLEAARLALATTIGSLYEKDGTLVRHHVLPGSRAEPARIDTDRGAGSAEPRHPRRRGRGDRAGHRALSARGRGQGMQPRDAVRHEVASRPSAPAQAQPAASRRPRCRRGRAQCEDRDRGECEP